MSDVNDTNTAGNSNFEQEYENYLREVSMMEASMDDLDSNGFNDTFGQPPLQNDPVEQNHTLPEFNPVEPNQTRPEFGNTVLDQSQDVAVEQSPLSSYLITKVGEDHYKNEVRKSDLTRILKDFSAEEVKNGTEQNAPLTKTNGHFYLKEELNVVNALKEIGLSDEQIDANKNKFHFEPIGRIGSPNGAFDAYVMAVNDSIDPQEAKDLKKMVDHQKSQTVQNYIDSHPKQEDIVKNLISEAQHFSDIDQAKKNSKRPPFISVGDAYFLNPKGLKSQLDNIEGVEGKYKLINILPKDESEQFSYPQASKDLNSHYTVQLGLYKVVTKNSEILSQADLEQKIEENLKHLNSPIINTTPIKSDADIHEHDADLNSAIVDPNTFIDPTKKVKPESNKSVDQIYEGAKVDPIVKPAPQPTAEKTQTKSKTAEKKPNATKAFVNSIEEGERRKDYKTPDNSDIPDEKKPNKSKQQKTIAEIAIEAASKVTQAAIAAAIAVAKMLVKIILEALKMLFSGFSRAANHLKPSIPIYDYGVAKGLNNMSNHVVGTIPTFTNSMDALKFKNGKQPDPDSAKSLDQTLDTEKLTRKEKAAKKLEDALNAGFAASPISESGGFDSKKPSSDAEFDPLAKLSENDTSNIHNLTPETMKSLENDVNNKLSGFDDQMKKDFINRISLDMLHSTSPELIDKLNEKTIYNDKHGIMLGEGDKVASSSLNGDYAVLSAYEKDSLLKYALVKEDENGEYSVEIRDAKDLQLKQHGAFTFDNKESLINAVDEKFIKNNDGFTKVEILDYQNPQTHALNVAEVLGKKPPVQMQDILEANRASIMDSLELEKTRIVPSLHKQGIPENPDWRMTHPTLHRLMDINDTVEAEINGNKLSGVIVGAHLNKGVLNYQIKKDDLFFKVPAKELTLVGLNNGGLSQIEIASIHAQKFDELNNGFKKELVANSKLDRVPLGSELLANIDAISEKPKKVLFSGTNHKEIKSLEYDRISYNQVNEFHDLKPLPILAEKLNHITNKHEYFVAIGAIGEREDAKALMVQVDKNILGGLTVTPGAKPKIEDLNANEITRIIPFNGKAQRLSSQLLSDYATAFNNGKDRHLQNAVDEKLKASPEIAANLKNEYYAANMAVAYLLKDQAESVVKTPVNLGANANLNNATINPVEPKTPETAPTFVQSAPTFDTKPSVVINQSTPSANPPQNHQFVDQVSQPVQVAQPTIEPESSSVVVHQVQQKTIEMVEIIPTAVPLVTAEFNDAQKPNVLNLKSEIITGFHEKVAPLISKFENDANSPYQNGLQLKTMLNGVYADTEFKRIQEHEKLSTQSLKSAANRLAEIAGVPVASKESPYEILNNVMNAPDANVKIKAHMDEHPQDKAEINQQLKDCIISADLYNSNLANYTNDIVDGIKNYTAQPIDDSQVKNDYIGMINDTNNIFSIVGEEAINKSKAINDFAYLSKELVNGNSPESIIKQLDSSIRNVDHEYALNTSTISSSLQNARDSIAFSINQIDSLEMNRKKDNVFEQDNNLTK